MGCVRSQVKKPKRYTGRKAAGLTWRKAVLAALVHGPGTCAQVRSRMSASPAPSCVWYFLKTLERRGTVEILGWEKNKAGRASQIWALTESKP